jgi:hypothetical protein
MMVWAEAALRAVAAARELEILMVVRYTSV